MLVIFRGLPGTGKSYLVRMLLREKPEYLVLSRDSLRASIFPHPTFGDDEKGLVDEIVVSMAGFLLARGRDVVIDGMALSSAARVDELVQAARKAGSGFRIVECICAETTALSRIASDEGTHPAGDRGESLYRQVKARFQPVPHPSLAVDTDRDAADNLRAILHCIETDPK